MKKEMRESLKTQGGRDIVKAESEGDPDLLFNTVLKLFEKQLISDGLFYYWIGKAAEMRHPAAMYHAACRGLGGRNRIVHEDARKMLRLSAELGSPEAQVLLGCLYCLGKDGFTLDLAEGRKWYLLAAKKGLPTAQYEIGMMMILGEGGERDIQAGKDFLVDAACNKSPNLSSLEAARMLSDFERLGVREAEMDAAEKEKWKAWAIDLKKKIEKRSLNREDEDSEGGDIGSEQ